MPRSAASLPTSVRKPLRMGVRKARRPSCCLTAASSPAYSACCIRSAIFAHSYTIERPPSATAFWVSSIVRTDGWWMIASATWSGSLLPERERIERRSFAYQSEFWKASSAAAMPCTAVPSREVLMKVNMWFKPRLGVPISQPFAPSNSSWQVGEPWQPILSSMRDVPRLFSSPVLRRLGTRKREMPAVPAGASGSRARTQCTMLSVMSCSPHEMKIFVPEMEYSPSAPSMGTALVVTWPRSEPHCGSVRHMVPVISPEMREGSHSSLRSSDPCAMIVLIAPLDRPGNISHVQFAAAIISDCTSASDIGSPCPPYCSGKESACQPFSAYILYASLNPGAVTTVFGSFHTEPTRSPPSFRGASTSSHIVLVASTTMSTVSRSHGVSTSSFSPL
mmetsp:Transcript_25265/g.84081  ORF Transcript_25265/g.84081 Transcript_25265/m.84081 type:complete len:392 (-) Transcript_25265:160-1335(-)